MRFTLVVAAIVLLDFPGAASSQDAGSLLVDHGTKTLELEDYDTVERRFVGCAAQGNAECQFQLGSFYSRLPLPTRPNIERWYQLAAEQGHAEAALRLARLHAFQFNDPDGPINAFKWYLVAAINGSLEAQGYVAFTFEYGERAHGITIDHPEALKWYRVIAERGDPSDQFQLGDYYSSGSLGVQDEDEALKWYVRAAEQGQPSFQYRLGLMYEVGEKMERDYDQAVKWYWLAAEQGLARAQYHLGEMYNRGEGVPQDYAEARKWFSASADQGDADALWKIGKIKKGRIDEASAFCGAKRHSCL